MGYLQTQVEHDRDERVPGRSGAAVVGLVHLELVLHGMKGISLLQRYGLTASHTEWILYTIQAKRLTESSTQEADIWLALADEQGMIWWSHMRRIQRFDRTCRAINERASKIMLML